MQLGRLRPCWSPTGWRVDDAGRWSLLPRDDAAIEPLRRPRDEPADAQYQAINGVPDSLLGDGGVMEALGG